MSAAYGIRTPRASCWLAAVCLTFVWAATALAAQAPSPFDLVPRLDEAGRRAALGLPPDEDAAAPPGNPFDIVRDGDAGRAAGGARAVTQPGTLAEARRERLPGLGARARRGTFDAVLALGLLLLFSITFVLQGGVLRRMGEAAFNENRLSRLLREQRRSGFYLWAFLGALAVATYAYAAVRELRPEWLTGRWSALDGFMLATLALSLAKLGALGLLKAAFPLARPVGRYQLLILIWLAGMGLASFPLFILVAFGPAGLAEVLAYAALPLLAVALALRSLSAVGAAGRGIARYPLHFLLYLCALEIGPLLVLYRAVSSGLVPGST